jgi:hypothetical protein
LEHNMDYGVAILRCGTVRGGSGRAIMVRGVGLGGQDYGAE